MAKKLERTEKAGGGVAAAAEMMKALGHPLRLSILCALAHNGEMTAGALVDAGAKDGFSQSQVSQYLGLLRAAGAVRARRDGQSVRYAIADPRVKNIVETLYGLYCG